MKRLKIWSIFVLIGAIMLSVASCKKYDDDIDQLRKDVDANKQAIFELNTAIKNGKLITSVTTITGGSEITFSDGTKIKVLNGTTVVDGFSPILGIDTDGYWTIITTKGGTAVRMTDTNGNPVKAVASSPVIGENGNWFVDGEDTGVSAKGLPGETVPGIHGKQPYINNVAEDGALNNWMVYDVDLDKYVDSGVPATGPKGESGSSNIEVRNGVLWIGDTETGIKVSTPIVHNDLNNTVLVTLQDENGEDVSYDLAKKSDITFNMVRSVACPASNVDLNMIVGKIVNTDAGLNTVSFIKQDGTTATYTLDQTTTEDKVYTLPMMVNPTSANVANEQVTIVDAKGQAFNVRDYQVVSGYDVTNVNDPFTKAKPAENTGLVSVNFKAGDQITLSNNQKLAIKVRTNDIKDAQGVYIPNYVFTTYDYAISVRNAVEVVLKEAYFKSAIGSSSNLLNEVLDGVKESDVMLSRIEVDPLYARYISISNDGKSFSTADDASTMGALEGKTVEFTVHTIDYTGKKVSISALVQFYVTFDAQQFNYPGEVVHVLDLTNQEIQYPFTPVWERITRPRVNYWSKNVSNLVIEFRNSNGAIVNAGGLSYDIQDIHNNSIVNVAYNSSVLTQPENIFIKVDPTVALPGTYTATLTFKDNRMFAYNTNNRFIFNGADYGTSDVADSTQFKTVITFKVENPDIESLCSNIQRIPELFFTDVKAEGLIKIYGTVSPYTLATNPTYNGVAAQWYDLPSGSGVQQQYNLNSAFSGLAAIGNAGHTYLYKNDGAINQILQGLNWNVTTANIGDRTDNMYKSHLIINIFGNTANPHEVQQVSPFWAQSRSEIEDGVFLPTNIAPVIRYADQTKADLSASFVAYDCYYRETSLHNNLFLFDQARDSRVTNVAVAVKAGSIYANMVNINAQGNNFVIEATPQTATLTGDVKVPFTISITDRYDRTVIHNFEVTIKK